MKIKFFFIIILLCSNYTVNAQKVKCNNCVMLDSLLNNMNLRQSLGIDDYSSKIIRIVDSKKYLKKCTVLKSYSYYIGSRTVAITNRIPLDINTGLFADIVILNIFDKDKETQIDIFFVNNQCENNIKHKYMCSAVFSCDKDKVFIKKVNFSHIQ